MAAEQGASPVVEFRNVNLRYDGAWALRNASFALYKGGTVIILGAAGSGKTTLLKAIIGLVEVDSGDIRVFGDDVTSLSEHQLFGLRSRVGMLFQEGGLFDSLSVCENVEYPLVNQQLEQSANSGPADFEPRVREALRFVELEAAIDKFPSEISGGMRRRVGIARAIVTEPPLVLYDSPTAGLDPITANLIMALVAKQRDVRNTTSLLVTNRYQDGELMARYRYDPERHELIAIPDGEASAAPSGGTRFLVMKEGEIVFDGTESELLASDDEYIKRFGRHGG